MAGNKTKQTDASVQAFLETVDDERKRADSFALVQLMQDVTGEQARMWGESIVGFGSYHYRYESGREGDAPLVGFSPRKQNIALYIMTGFDERDGLLDRLGKHKEGKACVYVNRLADVDAAVLRELVQRSVEYMRRTYPS